MELGMDCGTDRVVNWDTYPARIPRHPDLRNQRHRAPDPTVLIPKALVLGGPGPQVVLDESSTVIVVQPSRLNISPHYQCPKLSGTWVVSLLIA